MPEKMNPEIKAAWIEALESGEYAQCTGTLGRVAMGGTESFCCLGVLTELGVKAGITERTRVSAFGAILYRDDDGGEAEGVTPGAVAQWAGLRHRNPLTETSSGPGSLSGLNDRVGYTFRQIAEVIREQF